MSQCRKAESLSLNANVQTNAVTCLFDQSFFIVKTVCLSVLSVVCIKKVSFYCNAENKYMCSLQAQQLFYSTLKNKEKIVNFRSSSIDFFNDQRDKTEHVV